MYKMIFKLFQVTILFLIFWFLNSGFLVDPVWLFVQAMFFTGITLFIFKYPNIKLKVWIYTIGFLYILSGIMEMFKVTVVPDIAASTGFGILIIVLISSLRR